MGVFAFLFLISCASALNSPDWAQYSPQFTRITNTQDPNSLGFFSNVTNYSVKTSVLMGGGLADMGNGEDSFPHNSQPNEIVTKIIGTTQYLVMTDGSNLGVYGSNLNLLSSISSGSQVYSLSLFAGSNQTLKIAGIFFNGVNRSFKIYDYNIVSNVLNLTTTINSIGTYSSGVRCMEGTLYFGYNGIVCLGFTGKYGGGSSIWNYNTYFENGSLISRNVSMSSGSSNIDVLRQPSFIDANNDGTLELLTYNERNLVYMYQNGTSIWVKTGINADANFFISGITTQRHWFWWLFGEDVYAPAYKIVSTTMNWGGGDLEYYWLNYYNLDGTAYNGVSGQVIDMALCSGCDRKYEAGTFSVLDWEGDGIDDVAIPSSTNTGTIIRVYDSLGHIVKTGTIPVQIFPVPSSNTIMHLGSMISAKLNGDSYYDFIVSSYVNNTKMYAFDLQNNKLILNYTGFFIPVDFNSDGALELLGYNTANLILLRGNYTNQNAVLNTLTFLPSTSPAVYSPMTITIGATDQENDVLYYKVDCGNGVITETISNTRQCTYASTGDAWLTAYVRDSYHVTYSNYSQLISVGGVSNYTGNGTGIITPPDENTTSITATNGMTLPTQLVNPDNFNQGLLPEIYFGTLAFFSSILSPTIILVMVIFFALIMVTIGMIIKKIAGKVADMSSR